MAEVDRQRDRPLREGLDHVADLVQDWSGATCETTCRCSRSSGMD